MLVQQILGAKPEAGFISVVPGTRVSEAAAVLSARRIGALLVSGDGKTAAGIVTERDIVRELGRRGAAVLADPVEALMTRDLVTASRSDTAESVMERMTNGRFRHMPVVDKGEIVGLISIGDVVKARLGELAMEKDALQGMIMGQ